MLNIFLIMLLIFLIVVGGFAIFAKSLITSVIALSVFSITLTIVFLVLQAVDVAMTEAAIGAGLVTSFFVIAINKTEDDDGVF